MFRPLLRQRRSLFFMALVAAISSPSLQATSPEQNVALTMTLKPTWEGAAMNGLAIRYTFHPLRPDTSLTLDWPTLLPEHGRTTDQITDLQVTDIGGPLRMSAGAGPGAGDGKMQAYTSDRPPHGLVTVSYRVPAAKDRSPKGGPREALQKAAGGLVTSGQGVLLLPHDGAPILDARWDLPAGVEAQGSFGGAHFVTHQSRDDLLSGFLLAGHFRTDPLAPTGKGFAAYILGESRVTTPAMMSWVKRLYEAERKAFHGSADKSFRIFFVSYDGGLPDSGTADPNGILLYVPPDDPSSDASLKILMAHEMVHVWQPAFSDTDSSDWFIEGSAVYFESVIPYEAGLITRDEFLDDINEQTTAYYVNPLRNVANSQIEAVKWTTRTSWRVPYCRGQLYFADLDARVRKISAGKRTLFDVLSSYAERRGKGTDMQVWRDVLLAKVDASAVRAFDSMMAGHTIQPVDGAFGNTVRAEPTTFQVLPKGDAVDKDEPHVGPKAIVVSGLKWVPAPSPAPSTH